MSPNKEAINKESIAEHHTCAAECHDKAAAQYREAAKLEAAGETEKAVQCAKRAHEFAVQAMQHAGKSAKESAKEIVAGLKSAIGIKAASTSKENAAGVKSAIDVKAASTGKENIAGAKHTNA